MPAASGAKHHSKHQASVNLKFVDSTVGRELQAYCLPRRAAKYHSVRLRGRSLSAGRTMAVRRQRRPPVHYRG